MFKNFLKTTFRNIRRNKLFTIINIIGLAIGMACFILILLWIQDELSFNRFHENKDQLYLLTIKHPTDVIDSNVPYALAPILANEFPEIIDYTRIYKLSNVSSCSFEYQNKNKHQIMFYENSVILVDESFFSIFSFPFIHGNPQTALQDKNSIVITEEIAKKYFGEEIPLGKKLTFNSQEDLIVTGVVQLPANSDIRFDFLASLRNKMLDNWNWADPSYILLDKNVSLKSFKEKIAGSLQKHAPYPNSSSFEVGILPLSKVHLDFGRKAYIYIFAVIAIFILIIACINYMNLSTAGSINRAKEVGLRKVIGANRTHVANQFLGESILLSAFALGLALIMVELFLPFFNDLTLKKLALFPLNNYYMVLFLISLIIIVGIISGIYPALFLSSFSPIKVLSVSKSSHTNRSPFRIISVVGQFTISILLVISTIIIFKQLNYMRAKPLGFKMDYVLKIPINDTFRQRFDSYKNLLLKNPDILNVTTAQSVPYDNDWKTGIDWRAKDPNFAPVFRYTLSELDYIETFDMEIVQGRNYSKNFSTDKSNYIINEAAAKYMNMENPIDEKIRFWGREGNIIGVVKDFHHVSLHRDIIPQIIVANPAFSGLWKYFFVKVNALNVSNTIDYIRTTSKKFAPEYPFEFSFLDNDINILYESEQKLSKIISYFAFLAIFIACLGLFGLATFLTEQRTKEIGIRKVVGASIPAIITLLSKEFTRWVLLANIIAWPIAYFAMNKWLQNFAYRIGLTIWPFLLAGLAALAIALMTISWQAIKAARSNPVESLRYE